MGTSLTGTKPKDTYDSLIKVTDNGPLSGTAKYLSDGLGNDSKLALGTSGVGIGTTSPVTVFTAEDTNANVAVVNVVGTAPNYIFDVRDDGTSVFRVAGTGNVGIGTSSPANKLTVSGTGSYDGTMVVTSTGSGTPKAILGVDAVGSGLGYVGTVNNVPFQIRTNDVTRLRIDADGLKFGSDTAAANALDDYEEGDWTMGVSFGGGSTGVTTSSNTGTYTKIGRQVTVNGVLVLTSKGSSTGAVLLTGLPFTIGSVLSFYAAATLRMENVTFANQFQAYGGIGSTVVAINEITEAGVNGSLTDADFANNSTVMISLTYFV